MQPAGSRRRQRLRRAPWPTNAIPGRPPATDFADALPEALSAAARHRWPIAALACGCACGTVTWEPKRPACRRSQAGALAGTRPYRRRMGTMRCEGSRRLDWELAGGEQTSPRKREWRAAKCAHARPAHSRPHAHTPHALRDAPKSLLCRPIHTLPVRARHTDTTARPTPAPTPAPLRSRPTCARSSPFPPFYSTAP